MRFPQALRKLSSEEMLVVVERPFSFRFVLFYLRDKRYRGAPVTRGGEYTSEPRRPSEGAIEPRGLSSRMACRAGAIESFRLLRRARMNGERWRVLWLDCTNLTSFRIRLHNPKSLRTRS